MNKNFTSILTKIFLFIALMLAVPSISYSQKGKSVKSEGKSKNKAVKSKRTKGSYNAQKRSKKKSWNNQNKETRRRMKFVSKNARRRQKGKPMKSNRLTLYSIDKTEITLIK